ncbi:DNA-binding transcriptional regulator, AcrR family [Brevibacterium sandarakinum]|uniref:TetR/AcrR family transcriptional regulator n=2 Tax=Brevibacterium TaxID=1696 RepID=A0A556C802_BREAU|nr:MULTISPECIES: TetR/AcrR family transcriptional regulator [Brevibacterium]TSI13585.1 TetR/AcrR family transcriptional regulator [Brevibacterium aurantiacum]SDT04388.1 DNA-binding transcriptional regulator, AcrR family [Brevibacterium sandarakinum]
MLQVQRKDVVRNNRAILQAAGEIMRVDPEGVTIPAVAERAGLSAPTVYRYYPSTEALLGRYLTEVVSQVRDFSHDCNTPGTALFNDVLGEWGRVVEIYGPGLVQLRSRRGFLERLRSGDETMQVVREAWERPLRRVMKAHCIRDEHLENALFLFNMMFDPRELLDLNKQGLPMPSVLTLLQGAYVSALQGWQDDSSTG